MIQLRPYQQSATEATYAYLREGKGVAPVVAACVGAGKSLLMATVINDMLAAAPDSRALMLCHLDDLLIQNAEELSRLSPSINPGFYGAGLKRKDRRHQIIFANIHSIEKVIHQFDPFDLVLIEECFTGETEILTPSGPRRMDFLRCGDLVYNASGVGRIEAISVRPHTETLYEVVTNDGASRIVTGEHPFFTEEGWRPARELGRGSRLFRPEDVRALWEHVSSVGSSGRRREYNQGSKREALEQATFLLSTLCQEIEADDSYAGNARAHQQSIKENASRTHQERRERALASLASACVAARSGGRMARGIRRQDECWASEWGISESLQDRYREPQNDGSDRNRRALPHALQKTSARRKKASAVDELRVESVTPFKREGVTPVYNLHVSGHPSYFAAGALVHNCHLVPKTDATRYVRALNTLRLMNPSVVTIGYSGTPYRLDGGWLHKGEGAIFDGIAYEISIADLVRDGYLVPPVCRRAEASSDMSGVKTRAGEFVGKQMAARFDQDAIIREAVAETIRAGQGRRSGIVFCAGVDHAHHVAEEFVRQGEDAEVLTGATGTDERRDMLARHKAGRLRWLVNVNVATAGYNAPRTDIVAIMRSTASAALFVQMCGRGLRLCEGKEDCLILDFGGNFERHGMLDQITPREPGSGDGEAPAKACPDCHSIVAASARECPDCGHIFEIEGCPSHGAKAYDGFALSTLIEPEWLTVSGVTYSRHQKTGKPDSVRVTYRCGLRMISHWWCPEHEGYARRKTEQQWRAMGLELPETVGEVLDRRSEIPEPRRILVKPEGKYERVIRWDFEPSSDQADSSNTEAA